jgi:glutamate synthase domain-containing protein 1
MGSGDQDVGLQLREMLYAMRHRGVDSTGVTIAGQHLGSDYVMRTFVPDSSIESGDLIQGVKNSIAERGGRVNFIKNYGSFYRIGLDFRGNLRALADAVLEVRGVEIHSIGKCSEVIKDVGDAYELDRKHQISKIKGTHGLGHVRLATESQVDISHSHPFWAYPFPDISVVHNGQLTNYHNLKRKFQQRGFRFQTHNDSEVISVYIADKLSQGQKLRDVLHESLNDLDGTFTYVVSTASEIGMAKDRWSAKPFVVYETDELVAVASEEVALRRVFPDSLERMEPQESEVLTWSVAVAPVIGGR